MAEAVWQQQIMIGIPAIRNLIRENKVAQMYSTIQTGANYGMTTLDQKQLISVERIISPQVARTAAKQPESFYKHHVAIGDNLWTLMAYSTTWSRKKEASDLFITADVEPSIKINGTILPIGSSQASESCRWTAGTFDYVG